MLSVLVNFLANRALYFCNCRSSLLPETLKENPSEYAGDLDVILTTPLCAFAPYKAVAGPRTTSIFSISSVDCGIVL